MDELNNEQLKLAYWYAAHKDSLQAGLFGVVGALLLILIGYSVWNFTAWVIGLSSEDEMLKQLVSTTVETAAYNQRHAPLAITTGDPQALPGGNGTYDLVASVKNSNSDWAVLKLTYVFSVDGQQFSGESFLLPNEDKYLVIPQVSLTSLPTSISLELLDFSWRRIKSTDSYAWPNFKVTNERLKQVSSTQEAKTVNTDLSFILTNASAYGYSQVPVTVLLFRNDSLVALGRQVVDSLVAGDSKDMDYYWPGQAIYADRMEVKPEVDIFDKSHLLNP